MYRFMIYVRFFDGEELSCYIEAATPKEAVEIARNKYPDAQRVNQVL